MSEGDLKQELKIAKQKVLLTYPIQVTEWELIKERIGKIGDELNIPFLLFSVFLGVFLTNLCFSLTGNFPQNSDGSNSNPFSLSWAITAFSFILSTVFFFYGRSNSKNKQAKASSILEHMEMIEARYKSEELESKEKTPEERKPEAEEIYILEKQDKWENYLKGTVSITKEISPHKGDYCVKKDSNSDPHGGYRKLKKTIGLGFIFTGFIYRPTIEGGGPGDRIALEDDEFNGFGLAIGHKVKYAVIERRDTGRPKEISEHCKINPPVNEWYRFEFRTDTNGNLTLFLDDISGQRFATVTAVDATYNQFNRITIHGGYPYYVCGLEVHKV